MKLVLAEKPSVAQSIAKVLGATKREDVLGKRRVTKESFERWYASQTDYRTVEDQELDSVPFPGKLSTVILPLIFSTS